MNPPRSARPSRLARSPNSLISLPASRATNRRPVEPREGIAIHGRRQPPLLDSIIHLALATPSRSAQRGFPNVDGIPIRHLHFGRCARKAGKLLRRRACLDQLPSRPKLIREVGLSPLQ